MELKALNLDALLEVTERCLWLCLADGSHARDEFQAIRQEHQSRGTDDLFRKTVRRVALNIVIARRKVDHSPEFRSVKKLRRLLRFIVKQTLKGEPATQELIAVQLYKRHDLGAGAISAEVRRLRKKLEGYYQTSGLGDPIRFHIPKGKYIALITRMVPSRITDPLDHQSFYATTEIQVVPLNGLPGISIFPAFSPRGDQVAFSWNHNSGGYTFDVLVQSIGAATPLPITSSHGAADISPAWSPDGRRIAFLRVSLERGELLLTTAAQPPVETKITDLFPIRYEILTRQLAWSPDGKTLAVVDKPSSDQPFSIFLVSIDTGEKEQLTHPPAGVVGDSDPTFSPDGRALAFVRSDAVGVKDVFLLPLEADAPIQLTFDRKHIYGLAWLPDKGGIIFSSVRAGVPGLWRVGLGGEPPKRLQGIGERALHPACSANGGYVAYSSLVTSTSIWEIPLRGLKNSAEPPQKLIHSTRNDVNPDSSPDGSKIAFASDRSGTFEIWLCDGDGRNPSKVTAFESVAGAGTPRWSPDGRRIAFDCRTEGSAHIYVVTLSTGQSQRLTSGTSENTVPSWSRDGQYIYFSSNRSGRHEVFKMPSGGGEATQMTHSGGFGPMESPDGRFVYYARGRTAPGLWRMPVSGGVETLVLEMLKPTFWGLWAVVHEGIYFLDSGPGGPPPCTVKFLDFQTRSISDLAILESLKLVHYQGLALSPDHQRILYPQLDHSTGEIMLATTLR